MDPRFWTRFWIRFVIAVFGGAAVGLGVGAIGRYGFGADWNIFAVASWGIMAAAVALIFSLVPRGTSRRPDQDRPRQD